MYVSVIKADPTQGVCRKIFMQTAPFPKLFNIINPHGLNNVHLIEWKKSKISVLKHPLYM